MSTSSTNNIITDSNNADTDKQHWQATPAPTPTQIGAISKRQQEARPSGNSNSDLTFHSFLFNDTAIAMTAYPHHPSTTTPIHLSLARQQANAYNTDFVGLVSIRHRHEAMESDVVRLPRRLRCVLLLVAVGLPGEREREQESIWRNKTWEGRPISAITTIDHSRRDEQSIPTADPDNKFQQSIPTREKNNYDDRFCFSSLPWTKRSVRLKSLKR